MNSEYWRVQKCREAIEFLRTNENNLAQCFGYAWATFGDILQDAGEPYPDPPWKTRWEKEHSRSITDPLSDEPSNERTAP